jgi:glyoxylase-like metal-dependent hydrolase (beta-lactamase superfamily II)
MTADDDGGGKQPIAAAPSPSPPRTPHSAAGPRVLAALDALPRGIPVSYTPLYGAQGDGPAVCGLLRVGACTLLLDCGWDDRLDPALLAPLLGGGEGGGEGGGDHASARPSCLIDTVDAVLLSHATPAHSGALPYLVGRRGMRAPVLCTLPTARMAALAAYDALLSRQVRETGKRRQRVAKEEEEKRERDETGALLLAKA